MVEYSQREKVVAGVHTTRQKNKKEEERKERKESKLQSIFK